MKFIYISLLSLKNDNCEILANLFLLGLIKRKLDNTIGRLLNDIIYQIEYLNALC